MKQLDKIFNPKTIAVIGASNEKGSVGYALFENLTCDGFKGDVYPVNIKRKSIQGHKAYVSITQIPGKIDLAIIATPAKTVASVVRECGQAGVKGAVIISSGFAEVGEEGKKMSKEILLITKEYNIKIIGPNCLGFIIPKLKLNASFANKMALPGKIAFISQSGALCSAMLGWSLKNNVGFSHFISIGSMLNVGFDDLIDYLNNDSGTDGILIYMESLSKAQKFIKSAAKCAKNKPIIILKAGRSKEGTKAAKSHTGNLAGNDAIFDSAFKRAGIIRVDTITELFNNAKIMAMQPMPLGDKIAIITNAGGPGVIAVDALASLNGRLANISKNTIGKLNKILPPAWSRSNPIDILGDANYEKYKKTIELCIDDKNIDSILVILTPQAMTNPSAVARNLINVKNKNKKTIITAFIGGNEIDESKKILEQHNIPVYNTPNDAIQALVNISNYSKNIKSLNKILSSAPCLFKFKTEKSKKLIQNIISQNRYVLTELESKQLLSNYGIPILKNAVAKNEKEAVKMAKKLGFPVVIKILSSDILHKTDIKGVLLDINSGQEAKTAFNKIIKSAKKHLKKNAELSVLIEPQISKKFELLIGCKKDKIFGPTIVFGMGGTAVEVFKDTNIGIPPLSMDLALEIIKGTKIYRLLKGWRGAPGVDIKSIQLLLCKFSQLITDFPEISEIDINPFAIDEKGGFAIDAKIILNKNI